MERYNDDELVYLMRCGSQEAERCLYNYYYEQVSMWILPFIHYRFFGYDYEDYLQLAMVAFYQIIDYYRDDQKASLRTFMKNSVVRRILGIVRVGKKNQELQQFVYISLDDCLGDDGRMSYAELIEDPSQRCRPDVILAVKEAESYYETAIGKKASQHERVIVRQLELGFTHREIAHCLNIPIRSVYNAAYRYHKKLRTIDEQR